MKLAAARVVITGGAGSLGSALVAGMRAAGARIVALDIDAVALAALHVEMPDVQVRACDLTDADQATGAVEAAWSMLGGFDVLVNNAGLIHSAPLINLAQNDRRHPVAEWRRVIDANLNSVFYASRTAADLMLGGRIKGVIVNVSSISAAGNAGQSAYAAAKAGVTALTASWARELGIFGIRVVAIAPGFIDVASTRSALSEAAIDELKRRIPLRRLGSAAEMAQAVIALIENDYINGKVIALDGGLSL